MPALHSVDSAVATAVHPSPDVESHVSGGAFGSNVRLFVTQTISSAKKTYRVTNMLNIINAIQLQYKYKYVKCMRDITYHTMTKQVARVGSAGLHAFLSSSKVLLSLHAASSAAARERSGALAYA